MPTIPLTRGKLAVVDNEDFEELNKYKWCFDGQYAQRRENGISIRMHSQMMHPPKGQEVDHINRNKLDNRRSNLRVVSKSVNSFNTGMLSNNTSGVKGVVWDKVNKKWRSQIQVLRKGIALGRFSNIEDATFARATAERRYYNVNGD